MNMTMDMQTVLCIDREALEEFMDEYDKNGIDTIDSKSSDKGKATKKVKKKRATKTGIINETERASRGVGCV